MQHGPEHLARQRGRARQLDDGRRDEQAVRVRGAEPVAMDDGALVLADVARQRRARIRVDDGADVGREQLRIADDELVHRAAEHPQDLVGRVLGQAQHAQRGAALPGAIERRRQRVAHDLLRQRRAVDDHGVDAARLGDQRRERALRVPRAPS